MTGKQQNSDWNDPEPGGDDDPGNHHFRSGNVSWQIPIGVTKSNWEYVQAEHIARGYDKFLSIDPLTAIDRQIINRYLPALPDRNPTSGPVIADFGCGNGRTLAPLLRRGYRGVGIDLSTAMLKTFLKKESVYLSSNASVEPPPGLVVIKANLVELDGLASDSIDHGISMFSTLGMIHGEDHRASFLAHVRRVIRPGGLFIVHAHNVWFQIRHPGGLRWALRSVWEHVGGKSEFGDRRANYRKINQMFIHSFRRRELGRALQDAGFSKLTWFGILPGNKSPVKRLEWGSSLRVVGWIVVCE